MKFWTTAFLTVLSCHPITYGTEIPKPLFLATFDETFEAYSRQKGDPLSVTGLVEFRWGRFGLGLLAGDGAGSVEYGAAGNLNLREGTLCLWVQALNWTPADDAFHVFFEAGHAKAGQLLLFKHAQDGSIVFRIRNERGQTAEVKSQPLDWKSKEWHHVAVTWTVGRMELCVDGELVGSQTQTPLPASVGSRFRLGDAPLHAPREKRLTVLDQVCIFDRPLNIQQIQYLARGWQLEVQRQAWQKRWHMRVTLAGEHEGLGDPTVRLWVTPIGADEPVWEGTITDFDDRVGKLTFDAADLPEGDYVLSAQVEGIRRTKTTRQDIHVVRRKPEVVTLENELLALTFDKASGGLVAMENKAVEQSYRLLRSPKPVLQLHAVSFDAHSRFFPPEAWQTLTADETTCVSCQVTQEGAKKVLTVVHRFDPSIVVTYTVTVQPGDPGSEWQVTVDNQAPHLPSTGLIVHRVGFPLLSGLAPGEPEHTLLMQPRYQGHIVRNPLHELDDESLSYLGNASMSWQEVYVEGSTPEEPSYGLYLGSHDPELPQTELLYKSHPAEGHFELGVERWSILWPDEKWTAGSCVVALHEGDWHWGADRYRDYFYTAFGRPRIPEWIQQTDGWFGCGGPRYTFRDLPKVLDAAEEIGLNYLQLWSQMTGADEIYHVYLYPNPFMGTPEELKDAIAEIHRRGGHIGFYHNYVTTDPTLQEFLNRDKYRDIIADEPQSFGWKDGWIDVAMMGPEGRYRHLSPGRYYWDGYWAACPGSKLWQDYSVYWIVERWAREYGADAWYMDSVPAGYPVYGGSIVCFNTDHGHRRPQGVNAGLLEFFRRLRQGAEAERPFGVLNEGVCDFLFRYATHVLGVELAGWHNQPDVFTYTFPEIPIFSGTANSWTGVQNYYPGEEVTRQDAFNRVHLMGFRYDVLGFYNPSEEQIPLLAYLKRLIGLRKKFKAELYQADFRDTLGLGALPDHVEAKIFHHRTEPRLVLTIVDRRAEKTEFTLQIDTSQLGVNVGGKAVLHTLDETQQIVGKAEGSLLQLRIPLFEGRPAAIVVR